jgi:putative oxidoreductase
VFEQAGSGESSNALNDWMIRGAIAVAYIAFGVDKFGAGWTKFFDQVGFGQWFRYCTGVVEILGALLVLVPRTVEAGLALLACTMAGAALIVTLIIHRPQDSVFSVALLIVLSVYWWHYRGSAN